MTLRYRADRDLDFLEDAANEDLEILLGYVSDALTEEITSEDAYVVNHPNHKKYWDLLAAEVQSFGGNTIVNAFRGYGVPYREVLIDVANNLNVNFSEQASVELIEMNLLMKICHEALGKMSEAERAQIVKDMEIKGLLNLSPETIVAALQVAIKFAGFKAYMLATTVANGVATKLLGTGLITSGIPFVANASLMRVMGVFAGPIGWVITGLWTLIDIAGPAFRVTVPSVIQIAYMRQKYINKQV